MEDKISNRNNIEEPAWIPRDGPVLGIVLATAALASAWSLFNSQVLYASRLPYAMARDGWLPRFLAKENTRTAVPTNSLATCCVVAAVFAALPFGKLVVIDIILYTSEVILEFVALIVLRKTATEMPRPFKIKGGINVLYILTILPAAFALTVVWATLADPETDIRHLYIVIAGLASGIVLFLFRRNKATVDESP